ncbi:unnamed protein product [Paramecium pentaurelia]|uniref:Palmitoyltransferase n=1 Tax=Paramecium pentaurelia TaxID=43138 RepID=A0A8S1SPV3_9CILI|nr:unnamed protein product [Paramecium pentaurelia]
MKVRSGCSQFPTLLQIFSYVLFISNVFITYIHTFILEEKIVHYIIFSFLVLICIYFSLKTTMSDPIDNFVIQQQNNRGVYFDYEEHQLTQFCEVCIAYVKEQTKHCGYCNRCCEGFDHHCYWINNCIGRKNYKQFIGMIISTFLFLLYSIIVNARVINQYNKQELQTVEIYSDKQELILIIITIIFLIIEIIGSLFLLQLIVFHAYIYKKGITTFEYIIDSRNRQVQYTNPSIIKNIYNQDSKMKVIKNTEEKEQKPINLGKENEKQACQIFMNNEMIEQEGSRQSSKKIVEALFQRRKLTQEGGPDYQNEGIINFFSQRLQKSVDFRFNTQSNNIDTMKPDLNQFE